MKGLRKVGIFLLIILLVIQFIQPVANVSSGAGENDIRHAYAVPDVIRQTLTDKCYDCHSNHTRYTWYFRIQPIGWWLAAHVYEGKEQLNFSEFKSYRGDQAREKLRRIAGIATGESSHLRSYAFLRPGSEITAQDEQAINAWVSTLMSANP
jgi:hypothetical protein